VNLGDLEGISVECHCTYMAETLISLSPHLIVDSGRASRESSFFISLGRGFLRLRPSLPWPCQGGCGLWLSRLGRGLLQAHVPL
jgi:hypothetical protein